MEIDPDKTYTVKLARLVRVGAFTYKPLNEIEMTGALLARIVEQEGEEAIDDARPL
ncbi:MULTISPECIES: hypothetical protein [unclassified Rhizobium]|uniref:hypothetical protein n=1 Tax=unclassified Rhizobium TaxID=2613769 RepID=UPI001AD9E661|nr:MULTISPECIES: hypothetical protein [unclassified Rhizobium]MBO9125454.1 hypothetical protein [Rhizobium sp. 16-488-2b]MBO9176039.1 hypothetical protein [Rhizobium sp. 16-488-2a]